MNTEESFLFNEENIIRVSHLISDNIDVYLDKHWKKRIQEAKPFTNDYFKCMMLIKQFIIYDHELIDKMIQINPNLSNFREHLDLIKFDDREKKSLLHWAFFEYEEKDEDTKLQYTDKFINIMAEIFKDFIPEGISERSLIHCLNSFNFSDKLRFHYLCSALMLEYYDPDLIFSKRLFPVPPPFDLRIAFVRSETLDTDELIDFKDKLKQIYHTDPTFDIFYNS